jgi:hypothetical protein
MPAATKTIPTRARIAAKPAATRAVSTRAAVRVAAKPAVLRARAVIRASTNAGPAPRRPMPKKEFERLLAEEKRLCDKTPFGEFFYSPLAGMRLLKLPPFTEEDVYASY